MKRKNFPKNFPPSPNIAIHDALPIWRTVSPNGFLAGSGAAVHERERQGTAQGTCRILRIPRENLIALTQKSHAFALEVIVILGMRIRMLEKKLGTQGVRIETRLASFIWHRATFHGIKDTIELDMSREDLAGMFGTARETLSRNLSHLVSLGYIAVDNRKITILDRKGLEALIGVDASK